jgi:hypothetical protein
MALLEKKDNKLAFLTCDKFSIGAEDTYLNLQGRQLGPSDGILLAGVLKANEIVTSVKYARYVIPTSTLPSRCHTPSAPHDGFVVPATQSR